MTVAHVARLFNCLPSDLLAKDAAMFQIDLTAARMLWEWDAEQAREARAQANMQ